jgi:hypothetical protein
MKKEGFLAGIISILLLFTLVFAGCDLFTTDNEDDDDDDPPVNVTGTWAGSFRIGGTNYSGTLTVSSSGWTLSVPSVPYSESGTYTLSGSTATLRAGGYNIGTATVSGNSLTVVLNNDSDFPGTYNLTKSTPGNNDDDDDDDDPPVNVTGTWAGSFRIDGTNYNGTLTVSSTGWTLSVPSASYSASGTYTLSGSTATLRAEGSNIGTATVSGNSLTVVLNENSYFPGTYNLTKSTGGGDDDDDDFPPSSSTSLTVEQWRDGTLTAGQVSWYSFTASGGTYYVSWNDIVGSGKTADIKVSAYTSSGSAISGFTAVDSAWTTPKAISGQTGTIYLKVQGYDAVSAGTYAIKYSLSSSGNSTGGDSTNVTGTWAGSFRFEGTNYNGTLTVSSSGWTLSVPSVPYSASGTYTLSGSTATLRAEGTNIGTATVSGNNLTVVLNNNSYFPGTYNLTKSTGGNNTGGTNTGGDSVSVTGTWTGTFRFEGANYSGTLTVSSSGWTLSVPSASYSASGTYTLSGSTATLRADGYNVGTATVSGSSLTVVLNNESDFPGTYSLTKSS